MPSFRIWPSPPAPIQAAIVARPIVERVAILMPAIMTGIARGTSIFQRTWPLLIPMPTAASFTCGSTPLKPTMVLRTSTTSA